MYAIEGFEFHALVVLGTYSLEGELHLALSLCDMRENIIGIAYNNRHVLKRQTWSLGDVTATAVIGKHSVLTLCSHARSKDDRTVEEGIVVGVVGHVDGSQVHGH